MDCIVAQVKDKHENYQCQLSNLTPFNADIEAYKLAKKMSLAASPPGHRKLRGFTLNEKLNFKRGSILSTN